MFVGRRPRAHRDNAADAAAVSLTQRWGSLSILLTASMLFTSVVIPMVLLVFVLLVSVLLMMTTVACVLHKYVTKDPFYLIN